MKKRGFITIAVLLIILALSLNFPLSKELRTIILVILGLFITAFAMALLLLVWLVVEKVKMLRARRIEQEKEAHVKIVTAGSQVFIRETDRKAYWRAAHLDPRFYANGQFSEPTDTEVMAWRAFNSPKIIQQQTPMLPAQSEVDLLGALDAVQRCLIVGASDTGKTTLLQWIVSRRLNTSKVICIDPHAYPEKWPKGCTVVGAGRNYTDIDKALTALVQLMTKRYDEIGRGIVAEMAHSRITILIDEWRAIVFNTNGAGEAIKALLTESRKAAFSVFVATHSERVKALGIEGEGDLKDGFAIVRLSTVNGQRQAKLDTGDGEIPATLPGPYARSQAQIIEGRQFTIIGDENFDLEPEPTEQEKRILELHSEGASHGRICQEVWGYRSSNKYPEIDAVLSKFGADK